MKDLCRPERWQCGYPQSWQLGHAEVKRSDGAEGGKGRQADGGAGKLSLFSLLGRYLLRHTRGRACSSRDTNMKLYFERGFSPRLSSGRRLFRWFFFLRGSLAWWPWKAGGGAGSEAGAGAGGGGGGGGGGRRAAGRCRMGPRGRRQGIRTEGRGRPPAAPRFLGWRAWRPPYR